MRRTAPASILILLACALCYVLLGGQEGCPPTCTDADADGFAVEGGTCGPVDCDDADALVNPDAAEFCGDGVDNDCDGFIDGDDPDCPECWDNDGDGYDDEACGGEDCDDTDPEVHPGNLETCNGVDDDCDGQVDEGVTCELPNATATCAGVSGCLIDFCDTGWANCDSDHATGCETLIDDDFGTCQNAIGIGSVVGDENCGFGCPDCYDNGLSIFRHGEGWVQVDVLEDSDCCADVRINARLTVPAGVDYNLYLHEPCGVIVASSTNGIGQDELISYYREDDCFSADQSFTAYLEVRYYAGSSCADWILETRGGQPW
ncbi:putative metal-binding motif-containing protein [Thermodesulfobacteriota bacterium]